MGKNIRILIHSIAFSPDGVSTAYIYNDLAEAFKERGFEVQVLTTTPHFNEIETQQVLKKNLLGLFYKSIFKDIEVYHVWQKKYDLPLLRIIGFFYWHIVAIFLGVFILKKADIILSPSPPLTIGLVSLIIGKIRGSKVIYNVQEVYPDLIINQGGVKNKWLILILKKMEKAIYNYSDSVTTIHRNFYNSILERFNDKSKLIIIPNFVSTDLYFPMKVSEIGINKSLFNINEKVLKVMYAGNIGIAQDWESLIKLANLTSHLAIEYYVIGEGAKKNKLKENIIKYQLNNIKLIEYQDRNQMCQLINFADLHFIFMDFSMAKEGFPSKIFTIMACGKPILISSPKDSPIIDFLQDKNCSFNFSNPDMEENSKQMANTLSDISFDKTRLEAMGSSGLKIIQEKYTKEYISNQYMQLFEDLSA